MRTLLPAAILALAASSACARGQDIAIVEGSTESAGTTGSAGTGGAGGSGEAGPSGTTTSGEGAGGEPGPVTSASTAEGSGGQGGAGQGGDAGSGGNPPVEVEPGDLVITEIMANPDVVSDSTAEWFEIVNASAGPVPLQGLLLRHEAGNPAAVLTLATDAVLAPGEYFVLGKGLDPSNNGGVAVDYLLPADLSLTNTGDSLALERTDGTIIDYTIWGQAPQGASISLDPNFIDASLNDDGTHFCAATSTMPAGDHGTPGVSNDQCP